MTKLSSQLTETPKRNNNQLDSQGAILRTSSNSSDDLNGVLDSSPIYVTSVPNLSSVLSPEPQKPPKTRSINRPSSGVHYKSSKSSSSRSSPQETKGSARRHVKTRPKVVNDTGDADGSKSGDELELKHDLGDRDTPLIDLSSEHTHETGNQSTAEESGFDPSAGELTGDSPSEDLEDGLSDDSLPEKLNPLLDHLTADLQQEVLLDPPIYPYNITHKGGVPKKTSSDSKDSFSSRKSTGTEASSAAKIQGRQTHPKGTDPPARTPSPFNNMISMVELNTANRDRAIDVPESFIARTKTPPRYPPPKLQQRVAENTLPYNNNYYNESGKSKDNPVNGGLHRSVLLGEQVHNSTSEAEANRIKKYEEDLKTRRDREDLTADWQRTSIRESEKLRSLATSVPLRGLHNDAFDNEESFSHLNSTSSTDVSVGVDELATSLQHIQSVLKSNSQRFGVNMAAVNNLLGNREFQNVLAIQNKVQEKFCARRPPSPITTGARHVAEECMEYLKDSPSPAAIEAASLLSSFNLDGLLFAHDSIGERYVSPIFDGVELETMEPRQIKVEPRVYSPVPVFQEQNDKQNNVIMVRIDKKSNEHLGATIRHDDESGSENYQPIIIGRIVRGGAAEKCGRLRVGDEILEVNGSDVRGQTIHEVCNMLTGITGTLSFIIAPRGTHESEPPEQKVIKQTMHVKAHFDYDPKDDLLNPCRELAIKIDRGDILHVVDDSDNKWWQAYKDGETNQSLARLIPSRTFQQQREAERQDVVEETIGKEKIKKGKLLCAKKQHKKKNKQLYPSYKEEGTPEEVLTYEEVTLYYPTLNRKRPVVLIGPPNIGRHELRQKLMEDTERFAAAVPHTSRTKMEGEVDGQDYHFISRPQFEAMILSRRFVEHGEYERSYYGTSIDAIRHVVLQGKICVLNLHPVALEMLRMSDLKPYVVLVAPPSLDKLRHRINAAGQPFKDNELKEITDKARDMENLYGHYFDQVIINEDLDRTYASLMQYINMLERDPQWVPAAWLKDE